MRRFLERWRDFRCDTLGFHPIGWPGIKYRLALDDGLATYRCPRCDRTFTTDLDSLR